MNKNDFSVWDNVIHQTPDQMKRIASAKKAATSPKSIDKEKQTGEFSGSGKEPYHVTLVSCTCGDFIKRKLPCKHMYRLAMELGIMPDAFKTGINKNDEYSLAAAVAEIEKLPEAAQRIAESAIGSSVYNKHPNYKPQYPDDDAISALRQCPLFVIKPVPLQVRMAFMKKQEMIDVITQKGYEVPKLKKDDLPAWCAENAPEVDELVPAEVYIETAALFNQARRSTYSYLMRKYDWDYYFNGDMCEMQVPHGAQWVETIETPTHQEIHAFPGDEITYLLDKYGCNRCAGGFAAQER